MTHNKDIERILAAPALRLRWNQNFTWTTEDNAKLKILAGAGAGLD